MHGRALYLGILELVTSLSKVGLQLPPLTLGFVTSLVKDVALVLGVVKLSLETLDLLVSLTDSLGSDKLSLTMTNDTNNPSSFVHLETQ